MWINVCLRIYTPMSTVNYKFLESFCDSHLTNAYLYQTPRKCIFEGWFSCSSAHSVFEGILCCNTASQKFRVNIDFLNHSVFNLVFSTLESHQVRMYSNMCCQRRLRAVCAFTQYDCKNEMVMALTRSIKYVSGFLNVKNSPRSMLSSSIMIL